MNKKEKIIIANWKMKLNLEESLDLAKKVKEKFKNFKEKEVVICPNLLSLQSIKKVLKGSKIKLGAQNVFWEERGAYTGEVSPGMLLESGCQYVIIGHSERRKYLLENYSMIHQKTKQVLNSEGIVPIVCIGEESEERKTEKRDFVLVNQLQEALSGIVLLEGQKIIIAYEPIWAIGSGISIEPSEAEYAHKVIKLVLNDMFGMEYAKKHFLLVYGGSITAKNAKDFSNIEDINGLLVGGASLDVNDFYKIAKNF